MKAKCGSPLQFSRLRQEVKSPPSHGGVTGSSPVVGVYEYIKDCSRVASLLMTKVSHTHEWTPRGAFNILIVCSSTQVVKRLPC